VAEIVAEISSSEYAIDDWLSRFRWIPLHNVHNSLSFIVLYISHASIT